MILFLVLPTFFELQILHSKSINEIFPLLIGLHHGDVFGVVMQVDSSL